MNPPSACMGHHPAPELQSQVGIALHHFVHSPNNSPHRSSASRSLCTTASLSLTCRPAAHFAMFTSSCSSQGPEHSGSHSQQPTGLFYSGMGTCPQNSFRTICPPITSIYRASPFWLPNRSMVHKAKIPHYHIANCIETSVCCNEHNLSAIGTILLQQMAYGSQQNAT